MTLSVLCVPSRLWDTLADIYIAIWDAHINNLSKKLSSGVFTLSGIARAWNLKTFKTIYFAYIHSNTSFGIGIYGASTTKISEEFCEFKKKRHSSGKRQTKIQPHYWTMKVCLPQLAGSILLYTILYEQWVGYCLHSIIREQDSLHGQYQF